MVSSILKSIKGSTCAALLDKINAYAPFKREMLLCQGLSETRSSSLKTPQRAYWVPSPHLASVALGGLEAAPSQAAVWCGAAAADDLQLFLGAVGSVQKLLDELLQTHLGVGFPCSRLLKELVYLGDLPVGRSRNDGIFRQN